jgi:hypothetical protein
MVVTEDSLLITLVEAEQKMPDRIFARVYTAHLTPYLSHGGLPGSGLHIDAAVDHAIRRLQQRGLISYVRTPQAFKVSEAGRAHYARITAQ